MRKTIDKTILRKLPPGRFIRTEKIKDMSGNFRNALVWSHRDEYGHRFSYFCEKNGEYLGEYLPPHW